MRRIVSLSSIKPSIELGRAPSTKKKRGACALGAGLFIAGLLSGLRPSRTRARRMRPSHSVGQLAGPCHGSIAVLGQCVTFCVRQGLRNRRRVPPAPAPALMAFTSLDPKSHPVIYPPIICRVRFIGCRFFTKEICQSDGCCH